VVSAARPKIADYPFTTLHPQLGVVRLSHSEELVVADIPGLIEGAHEGAGLGDRFLGHVERCAILLHLVDGAAGNVVQAWRTVREELHSYGAGLAEKPELLVLNKVDLVPRLRLLPLTAELAERLPTEETYMVSAANGDGVTELLDATAAAVPAGPHLYPDDEITDLPDRLLAAEIVREQIFLQTHEEVPYGTTVETESFTERPDGSVRIDATIYVARAGQKAILIGEGGARVRDIGARARSHLGQLLDRTVHLFLNVKERSGWDEERARLRAIGLDDPD